MALIAGGGFGCGAFLSLSDGDAAIMSDIATSICKSGTRSAIEWQDLAFDAKIMLEISRISRVSRPPSRRNNIEVVLGGTI